MKKEWPEGGRGGFFKMGKNLNEPDSDKADPGDKKGGKPVRLAKTRKNSSLNVLNPAADIKIIRDEETAKRMAEVFKNGIETDENKNEKIRDEKLTKITTIKVANEGVKKETIGDKGDKAAVEATVVAEERGGEMDGKDGGDELGEKKESERDVEPSFFPD